MTHRLQFTKQQHLQCFNGIENSNDTGKERERSQPKTLQHKKTLTLMYESHYLQDDKGEASVIEKLREMSREAILKQQKLLKRRTFN
eukprot:scaffold9750_cov122-Skeletonema_marinoi.AAC.1